MVAPALLMIGSFMGGMAMNPISALTEPYITDAKQWSYSKHPSLEAPPSDLILAKRRGRVEAEAYRRAMRRWGYSDDRIAVLEASAESYPDLGLLANAYIDKRLERVEFEAYLKALGYPASQIPEIESWIKPYPSLQDFIMFIVREAFNSEAVAKQGMDESFNEVYAEASKYLNVDEEVLKWYWRSHWQLPSPQMAFEFRHRLDPEVLSVIGSKYSEIGLNPEELAFTSEDLEELLKYNDYMPPYRPRLEAITYQPLTRIDLRRIYQLGLIDDRELKARLREIGYSPKDADLMVEFYREYTTKDDKDLSKSEILAIYSEAIITRDEAMNLLEGLGYDTTEADYILSITDHRIKRRELKEEINDLQVQYIAGAIDINQVEKALEDLNLSQASVRYYKGRIQKAKNRNVKQPSKADLDRWITLGLISKEDYKNRLEQLGYIASDIELFVKELGL